MDGLKKHLVDCARVIARFQSHIVTESGLQPLLATDNNKGLMMKLTDEWHEFLDALQARSPDAKVLEGADILYYSAQVDSQLWSEGIIINAFENNLRLLTHLYKIDVRLLTEVTYEKYAMRKSGKFSKDPLAESIMAGKVRERIESNGL